MSRLPDAAQRHCVEVVHKPQKGLGAYVEAFQASGQSLARAAPGIKRLAGLRPGLKQGLKEGWPAAVFLATFGQVISHPTLRSINRIKVRMASKWPF